MNKPYTGGCACGAIRYQIIGDPVFQNHCQCRDCQRRSGTGHGSYLTFARHAEVAIKGEAETWGIVTDSGDERMHAFCPTCGTPVYLTFVSRPEQVSVHAASLDDPERFIPQAVTYTVRSHAWDRIDPALQAFARMPNG